MASNTPWILRANDPMWRDDHDYKKGHRITGSNGAVYIARQDSGPNTAAGAKNPVSETTGDYWISLADSLKSGGDNELTGATTAKKLETPRTIAGVNFDGSADISNYAVCATQSSSAEKAVSIENFVLVPGASARIRFTNGNTSTNPTLDISGTGARELRFDNAQLKSDYIDKNGTYDIVYDGTYYQVVNGGITLKAPAADKLSTARSIQGVNFDGTSSIVNYAVCTTAADHAAKEVSLRGFDLVKGALVHIKFANGSTNTEPTLNVNKTGAHAIKWNGETLQEYFIDKNGIYDFVYDGDYYQMLNGGPTVVSPSAKKLETPKAINGVEFDGTGNISNYGVCDTAQESSTKVATLSGFTLTEGASARIKFTNGNSTTTPTLNINGTGAIPLKYNGSNLDGDSITTNGIYDVIYDGTSYQIVNGGVTTRAPSATKLANARAINGVQFDGTCDIANYGVCATPAATAGKTVTINNFVLAKGASARIRFTFGNTSTSPTLNINNTGAKQLKYNNSAVQSYFIDAQGTYEVVYDGMYYQLVGNIAGSSTTTVINNSTNITNINTPGDYVAHNTDVTTDAGFPYDAVGKDISLNVTVNKDSTYMCQNLHIDKSEWQRFSEDGGKTWGAWHPIGGSIDELGTVYLALDGDDSNTGLQANKPVRTVERALEICRNVHLQGATGYSRRVGNTIGQRVTNHGYCVLSFGAGDWGEIWFQDVEFNFVIKSTEYDLDFNEYNSNLAYFKHLFIVRCQTVDVCGICYGWMYIEGGTTNVMQTGYLRGQSMWIREYAKFITNYEYHLDLMDYNVEDFDNFSTDPYAVKCCFYLSMAGKLCCYWAATDQQGKMRVISNINLKNGNFLYCTESESYVNSGYMLVNRLQVNSGCTVTGKKYTIGHYNQGYVGITKAEADSLPGTKAGEYGGGRIVIASAVSGTNWWRKWSDGWIEQGGRITAWQPSANFVQGTVNFHTAFTNANSISTFFTVSQIGTWGINGNYADDTTLYEVRCWSTGCIIGVFDHGTHDANNKVVVSINWRAVGY